jgi:acetylornithine deacetylase/succinyl-diaminopimelate desuccinylase-like protein
MLEGEEENGTGLLEDYLIAHPDDQRFKADLVIVADTGNVVLGKPTVTTTLRGVVTVDVAVQTLRKPVHSGMYGGPVPDAFMCLVRLLSTLHDASGDVAVTGLAIDDLPWPAVDEAQLRKDAAMLDGVPFVGTGTLAQRLYGKASVNVVGLDAGLPRPNESANVLRDKASARISMRTAPTQSPAAAQKALIDHLKAHAPWGVQVETTPGITAYGFSANPKGRYFPLVEQALKAAYPDSAKVERAGQGGSIPLVHAFQVVNPNADIVLWGCEEPVCGIHGPDESVSHAELQAMATAEALLLDRIGKADHHNGGAM